MNKSKIKTDARWNNFYKFAASAALLIVLVGLVDIVTSMTGGEVQENSAVNIVDWFTLFQATVLPRSAIWGCSIS